MEFDRSAVNSAKTIARLEAKCDQLQRENIDLKEVMEAKRREEEMKETMMEKCVKAKDKYKKVKEKFELEERKWREEEEKISSECRRLGADKKKLEIDLEAATRSTANGGDDLAKKLKAAQDKAIALANWMKEKDGMISFTQNESLVLTHRIQVLEEEKGQLEAELHKVKEDNRSKDERICVLEEVKEAEKRAMGDAGKKEVSELTCRIGVLERENRELDAKFCRVNTEKSEEINQILNEKRAMEAESDVKVLDLNQRIDELEREKRAYEDKVCQTNKEKNEEISRISNEKMVLQDEKTTIEAESTKKVLELGQRIEVLERESREMEAEVCREKKEKSEEMSRILNEKMAIEAEKTSMETESKKEVLELVQRIEALEREIEAEVFEAKEKSEKIKRILDEKTALQEKHEKRILEREKQGLDAETGNNDEVAQILAQEDQGSQSDDVSIAEPNKESSIVDVEVKWHDGRVLGSELLLWSRARTRSQKRKIEAL